MIITTRLSIYIISVTAHRLQNNYNNIHNHLTQSSNDHDIHNTCIVFIIMISSQPSQIFIKMVMISVTHNYEDIHKTLHIHHNDVHNIHNIQHNNKPRT